MFFLAFIIFASLIVWLVLNGLNEMRWVQAHSHDASVAADTGIIPSKEELSQAREKLRAKAQEALAEDGIVGRAKVAAQDSFKDDGVIGRAKQKVRDGEYVEKARELSKGTGEKLKSAGAAAKNKVSDLQKK